MILLLFLFLSIESRSTTGFTIMALEVTFEPISIDQIYCDNDSCAQTICQLLANTSIPIAYTVLSPLDKNFQCPTTKYNISTNMISFILNQKLNMSQAIICSDISKCLSQGCQNFKHDPNAFMFAFTGQCYQGV